MSYHGGTVRGLSLSHTSYSRTTGVLIGTEMMKRMIVYFMFSAQVSILIALFTGSMGFIGAHALCSAMYGGLGESGLLMQQRSRRRRRTRRSEQNLSTKARNSPPPMLNVRRTKQRTKISSTLNKKARK